MAVSSEIRISVSYSSKQAFVRTSRKFFVYAMPESKLFSLTNFTNKGRDSRASYLTLSLIILYTIVSIIFVVLST